MPEDILSEDDIKKMLSRAISQPLITNLYSADPSAHLFDGKIFIYPSHDIETNIPFDDLGSHFAMEDYHVYSMETPESPVVDHGCVLHVRDVLWAEKQMWAPDAAYKNGMYYLYFPAKDKAGIFHIGVAKSTSPAGPFKPEINPIDGSYSIDPAVFEDADGRYYMYFGGIWGGQLQSYRENKYDVKYKEPVASEPALGPRVALLTEDMLAFAETPREIDILDEAGNRLLAGDNDRRFFEASWMHKHAGRYYFSYSTGDTHFICYAIGDNPYGPFTYQGQILSPVLGWTTHHSICAFGSKTYLFYHDASLSGGVTHLRSVKVAELKYDEQGKIIPIEPYR